MSQAKPLPEAIRRRLDRYVRLVGERRAVDALSVSRQTLARALGGLGLYGTSQIAIEARLDALEAADRR